MCSYPGSLENIEGAKTLSEVSAKCPHSTPLGPAPAWSADLSEAPGPPSDTQFRVGGAWAVEEPRVYILRVFISSFPSGPPDFD